MNDDNGQTSLSYKDAGVDIDAGNALVERIKGISRRTRRPEVLGGLGGFGALCEIPQGYRQPVLVAGTDGVGTKLRLAMDMGIHDTIGIDLVAMCVNDLVVAGAEPLFFLDYYATGSLDVDTAADVVTGIGAGCELAGCALVGGETAEMPGMYDGEDYDLAGFCVGVVEKSRIIDGAAVKAGDALLGIASSGPHSNGYSLIRKILDAQRRRPGPAPGRYHARQGTAGTDHHLRQSPAFTVSAGGGQGPVPHHRWRPAGKPAAGTARGLWRANRHEQLGVAGDLPLAAGPGQRRNTGDVPHLQLWRGNGDLRGPGRLRRSTCATQRGGTQRLADRHDQRGRSRG